MKWIIALLLSCISARAATITAASVAHDDVVAAITASANGDTVIIPPGTAYWTNVVSFTGKAITVQGSGTNNTIIVDEIKARTSLFVIQNLTTTNGFMRLTNLQIKGGTTNTGANLAGILFIKGSQWSTGTFSAIRVDHVYWNRTKGRPAIIYAFGGVLLDNCTIDQGGSAGFAFDGRVVTGEKGDASWATPVLWGTTNAGVYIEHCWITNSAVRAITDTFGGARYVFRYNTCYNVAAENHGTESTLRARGGRSAEVYGNTFICTLPPAEYAVFLRSGTALVFSNSVTGNWPGLMRMVNDRDRDSFNPWKQANGTNVWDVNIPGILESGTHNGATGSILIDTTKSWTVAQWVGTHVINLRTAKGGEYSSNTSTSFVSFAGAFSTISWLNGDAYEMRRVDKALDQCGAGAGDLLVGGSDTVPPTPTTWPNQANEPIRYWDNTGILNVSPAGYYVIKAGRNYTNQALAGYVPLVDPHPLASGIVAPTTNAVLSVTSLSPSSGVAIIVSPDDLNSLGNGTTTFARTYTTNIVVTLTAPATAGGNPFSKWKKDGVDYGTDLSTNVLMDLSHTLSAIYVGQTYLLTVNSTNPASGVSIQATVDNNAQGTGISPFTRTYDANVIITLIAPSTAGGKNFQKWQKDGADNTFTASSTITMDSAHTMTAVYVSPPPPPSSITIGHRTRSKTSRQ